MRAAGAAAARRAGGQDARRSGGPQVPGDGHLPGRGHGSGECRRHWPAPVAVRQAGSHICQWPSKCKNAWVVPRLGGKEIMGPGKSMKTVGNGPAGGMPAKSLAKENARNRGLAQDTV